MIGTAHEFTPIKTNNYMPLIDISPAGAALHFLRRADYPAAVAVLRQAIDAEPASAESADLARIANLITPHGQIAEAIDALNRLTWLNHYYANVPLDEGIGRTVPIAMPLPTRGARISPERNERW